MQDKRMQDERDAGQYRWRAGHMRCRTGRMQNRSVALLVLQDRCRTGHMKNRKDAVQDMQNRMYTGQVQVQDKTDAGQVECRT